MGKESKNIWDGMTHPKASVDRQKAMGDRRDKRTDGDAILFAPIMAGMASEEWKADLGVRTMNALHEASADALEKWFKQIVKLKRAMEDPDCHRNTRATCAFWRYEQEHGEPPTKAEFKAYLKENPCFGEFPPFDDADADPIWSKILNCAELRGRFRDQLRDRFRKG